MPSGTGGDVLAGIAIPIELGTPATVAVSLVRAEYEARQKAGSESPLEEVIITNSVPLTPGKVSPKVHVLSVAPLLAEAIRRIHDEESVSTLFV